MQMQDSSGWSSPLLFKQHDPIVHQEAHSRTSSFDMVDILQPSEPKSGSTSPTLSMRNNRVIYPASKYPELNSESKYSLLFFFTVYI